jgi:mRNA-degrading endonuclease RelE of RelBE toxin-antitoxin system
VPRSPEFVGGRLTIQCLELADGSCPAGDFLDSLSTSERRKLDVLFELMGDRGQIFNPEKFKKLAGSDGLFEFKSHQIRIPCIFGRSRSVVLLFGLRKKSDRYKRKEIERAEEYREWYLSRG